MPPVFCPAFRGIIIRGIERRKIFRNDTDRDDLLNRLEILLPETKASCYAWSLLSNHAHFLFRTGTASLSTLMSRLLTGYAVTYNRRHKRHGQLFQNRYKSIICQEDIYFNELVRYIHLNPLRAKIVSDINELDTYAYCGHSVLMGNAKRPWQDEKYVFAYFGKSVKAARKGYLEYMEEGVEQGRRPELVGGGLIRSLGGWKKVKKMRISGQDRIKGDQRILGESDFVVEMLADANEKFDRFYELKSKGYDLKTIEEKVCRLFGVESDEIYSKSRQKLRAEARGLYCYWAVRELGNPLADLARLFGMTGQGVGYAVRRGERIAKENHFTLTG
jgi:putative transposase